MQTTVIGSYPKVNPRSEINLRQVRNAHERAEAGPGELADAYRTNVLQAIRDQEETGLDLITDGQIWWDDLITPVAYDTGGTRVEGLVRWFDTNFYYRRPVITGPLSYLGSHLADEYRWAANHSERPLKAVLPAPLTFARLCQDQYYENFDHLLSDAAGIIGLQAQAIARAGAPVIQFDDPQLAFEPERADDARQALEKTVGYLSEEPLPTIALAVYYRDLTDLVHALAEFPVDLVSFDLTAQAPGPYAAHTKPYSDAATIVASEGFPKQVGLGCLNAREVRLESVEQINELLSGITAKVDPEQIWIHPSSGLEFLPHDAALAKLERLAEVAKAFGEGEEVSV